MQWAMANSRAEENDLRMRGSHALYMSSEVQHLRADVSQRLVAVVSLLSLLYHCETKYVNAVKAAIVRYAITCHPHKARR